MTRPFEAESRCDSASVVRLRIDVLVGDEQELGCDEAVGSPIVVESADPRHG